MHFLEKENKIICPTALVFQEGVKPMWEDDKNKTGGRWLVSFDKKSKPTEIDRCWLETVSRMPQKVRSYYTAIVLRCRTAPKLRCYCIAVSHESYIHFNLKCGEAAMTCSRR